MNHVKRTCRVLVVASVCAVAFSAALLSGCATTPSGEAKLSDSGRVALETAARIAVRHAIADSPRASQKAARVRAVVDKVAEVTTANSTLAGLRDTVRAELDRLPLSPLDRADAEDLLNILYAALEAQLGPDLLSERGQVAVNDFLRIIRSALPPA